MHYEETRLPPPGASLALAKAATQALAPYARPATAAEVCTIMERLRLHWDDWKAWTPTEAEMAAEDWIEDLAGQPIGALFEAARQWRQSGKAKPPNSGQLLALARKGPIDELYSVRRRIDALRDWFERAASGELFATKEGELAGWERASKPENQFHKFLCDREHAALVAKAHRSRVEHDLQHWKERVAKRLRDEGIEFAWH